MVDDRTPAQRRYCMSRIRSKDTKPEMFVRRLVHSLGYRYRLHDKNLPGTPDLVFKKRKKVILVHGCFWHQHNNCKQGRTPKSRQGYWKTKLAKNVERDLKNKTELIKLGWSVMTIWECQISDTKATRLTKRIVSFLLTSTS